MVEDYIHVDLSNQSMFSSQQKDGANLNACYYCRFTDDRCSRCTKRFQTRSVIFMCQFLVMVVILFAAQYIYDKTT